MIVAIVAVITDLFFGVQVMEAAKAVGKTVRFATSIDQALELLRAEPHAELLLADLNCRDVDTVELVRLVRADPAVAGVPAAGFISHVQEERKRAALAAGYGRVLARSALATHLRPLLAGATSTTAD